MVVDRELNVVFLDELLQARQVLVGGSADGDGDTGGLEVLKFGTDVGVVIFGEGDIAGSGEFEPGGTIGRGLRGDQIERNHDRVGSLDRQVRRLGRSDDHVR